jgi:hypothetical protein
MDEKSTPSVRDSKMIALRLQLKQAQTERDEAIELMRLMIDEVWSEFPGPATDTAAEFVTRWDSEHPRISRIARCD